MKVLTKVQSFIKKVEFEESKNIIIPGNGEQGVALQMLVGASAAVIGAVGIGGRTVLGAFSLPTLLLAGAVFGGEGAIKAYKMTTQHYWNIVFEKLGLKVGKEIPILKQNTLFEDGREFAFEVPIGMSVKDFQDKKEAIERAFERKSKISLDESNYQVKVFLETSRLISD